MIASLTAQVRITFRIAESIVRLANFESPVSVTARRQGYSLVLGLIPNPCSVGPTQSPACSSFLGSPYQVHIKCKARLLVLLLVLLNPMRDAGTLMQHVPKKGTSRYCARGPRFPDELRLGFGVAASGALLSGAPFGILKP